MADVELRDVTRTFLESDTLQRPLQGLNDSPKRCFLQMTSVLKQLGWKPSALDECRFYDPDTNELAGFVHACQRRSIGKERRSISSFGACAEGDMSGEEIEKKHRKIIRQFDHHSVAREFVRNPGQNPTRQPPSLKSSLCVNATEHQNG